MSSYRITVNEIDRSSSLLPNIGNIGAMVVRSKRGPIDPILISTGQEQRIVDIFGLPDSSNPDVIEAIEYNKTAALWMNSPFSTTTDFRGGIIATADEVVGYVGTNAIGDAASLQQSTANLNDSALASFAFSASAPNEYFILHCIAPAMADFLKVSISYSASKDAFSISLYIDREGSYELYNTYEVSLTDGAKNGFGEDIFIERVFEDNDFIRAIVNTEADSSNGGFVDSNLVSFTGSYKATNMASVLENAWNKYQSKSKYPAKIFMDPSTDSSIPAVFNTLRNTYQKYSSYIFAMPISDTASTVVASYAALSLNNRGLAAYWNQGLVRYKTAKFWTSLVGRVGAKYAQMVNVFNGLAPSWKDENNHGGQLGPGILELKYDPTEDQLETIETGGVNPIIFHQTLGVMISGQKTAKSSAFISDDSYIGHSRLFDTIIENITNQVLVAQITKLNDDTHRRQAVMLGNSFMQPLTEPSLGLINDYRIKCDSGNNDAIALSQRKFVFSLAVQVTPFSEFIVFNFIKTGQTITVDSVLQ